MESNEVKIVVQRYLDGETTLQEEQQLAEYLASIDDIPTEWIPIKMMLGAMADIRTIASPISPHSKPNKLHYRRSIRLMDIIGVAVAACAIFGLIFGLHYRDIYTEPATPAIICHIDGKLVGKQEIARAETERILGGAANDIQLAMARIEKINSLLIE